MWWLSLSLLVGLWGCSADPVQELVLPAERALLLTSTLKGGTEGEPGMEYVFTAVVRRKPVWFRIEWDFGDGSPRLVHIANTVASHRFQEAGTYTVVARLFDQSTGTLWAIGALVANIRPTPAPPPMVLLLPGRFLMGSLRDISEQPVHEVVLTRSLLISPTEVTQSLWDSVMGYNPSWFRGERRPVENITWWEAIDFCNRLSLRHGLRPCYVVRGDTVLWERTANGYRLPTEAEWEYACRAGSTTDTYAGDLVQPWGGCDDEEPLLQELAWYCRNSNDQTHPVGQKRPNAFGLYDMLGNVAEWVWDWFSSTAYGSHELQDPVGPPSGMDRVVRGGGWNLGSFHLRSASRVGCSPWLHTPAIGFRIVRNP
ncbi:MAG: SUMF1/EgtB/PvdO family nonheme iron enzyme [Candidatus Kapabacteria bacterium]|nr:SUMF1/EgtB/PvdO family nonheme iron enzyme [Candidatus Kapabacteria bacterium]MCS7169413.1 SUMF1/EgtB/PvdO family nonheme iron enzyme [Candidatus Kapabacteria bacterium]MDW7997618.1 SUMF1/EgtB/PvdO family nonheme iron enzyme [Bacteroidota bacterium]MDW8224800.1 SUMF1/EgtB/PvdO family nonheme iron enzyme [Bacteroidota bacterium]